MQEYLLPTHSSSLLLELINYQHPSISSFLWNVSRPVSMAVTLTSCKASVLETRNTQNRYSQSGRRSLILVSFYLFCSVGSKKREGGRGRRKGGGGREEEGGRRRGEEKGRKGGGEGERGESYSQASNGYNYVCESAQNQALPVT